MKKLFIIIVVVFFSQSIFASQIEERLGVKGPLQFNKTEFNLSWTAKPRDNYYIQEYLPKEEDFSSYNQMLTIRYFDADIQITDAVAQMIKELKERQKTDAICQYQVSKSPDDKEFIVDFVLSSQKNDSLDIIELNIYHYSQVEVNHKKGIMIYAYTTRSYKKNMEEFMKNLGTTRINRLNEMISTAKPVINIQK